MFVECWAVTAVVLALAFIGLRRGRKAYFWGIIPLTFVPIMHIIGYGLFALLRQISEPLSVPFRPGGTLHIALDLIGVIAACICFGVFMHRFKSKKARAIYLFICGGFTCIFALILLINAA